jgi:outer membrane protein TolC
MVVVDAVGQVLGQMSVIRHLAEQSEAQERALENAQRATEFATDHYRAGIVAYIEVVDASRDALTAERANAQLAGQRLIAAVQPIKAIGGGWTEQQLLTSAAPAQAQPSTK